MKNNTTSISPSALSNVTGGAGGWTGMISSALGGGGGGSSGSGGGGSSGGGFLGNAWNSVKGAISKPFSDIANIGAGGKLF